MNWGDPPGEADRIIAAIDRLTEAVKALGEKDEAAPGIRVCGMQAPRRDALPYVCDLPPGHGGAHRTSGEWWS
jgi:hypothetical protein